MRDIKKVLTKPALAAVVAAGIFLPGEAAACGQDSYVGSVCFMATDFCPQGTLKADGTVVPVNQYQALFALLGFAYGGDNQTMFAVPDLRGRAAVGSGTGTGLPAVARAAKIGQATQTLTVPLPQHTHIASFTPKNTTPGTGTTPVVVPTITGTGQTVSGITITNTLALIATTKGSLNIASSSATGGSSTPSNGAVFARPGVGSSNIYASASANTTIGPEQTFTGDVTGTVTSTASGGTVTGTPNIPSFTLNVPTTLTQGDVAVTAAGTPAAAITVSSQAPSLGLTACIVSTGLYPSRP